MLDAVEAAMTGGARMTEGGRVTGGSRNDGWGVEGTVGAGGVRRRYSMIREHALAPLRVNSEGSDAAEARREGLSAGV